MRSQALAAAQTPDIRLTIADDMDISYLWHMLIRVMMRSAIGNGGSESHLPIKN